MKLHKSSPSSAQSVGAISAWPNILAGAGANAEIGWGRGVESLRARELSLVMHLLVAVLVLFPVLNSYVNRGPGKLPSTPIFFPRLPERNLAEGDGKKKGSGNGGAREAEAARQGLLPRSDEFQLTPPAIPRNPQPILPAAATVVGPPEVSAAAIELWGDPFSKAQTNSQGPGVGNGFGDGCCGGVGPGKGRGSGPSNGSGVGDSDVQRPGRNGVGYPECVYCPTPSFSEEARKSKLQGSVTLHIVVGTDGRAANIRVVRGLGMGLDERAMEAVRGWRFKPALGPGGKPVPTEVLIEVTFRLL